LNVAQPPRRLPTSPPPPPGRCAQEHDRRPHDQAGQAARLRRPRAQQGEAPARRHACLAA
jgi:hypothetical protein